MSRVKAPVVIVVLVAIFPWLAAAAAIERSQSPRDIIDQVDRVLRGDSSHGVATMEVVTEHWTRSLTMEIWSLGTEHSLIRVTAPAKEAGTATLKADKDIWNYLPKVDRTIKIPASMMSGSWMGSHFTNDDLVKDSRLIDQYEIEITFEGERDAETIWEFTLTPLPDAPVVWGSIEMEVRKSDLMPLASRYFDEDGVLSRTIEFADFEEMGGRLIPAVMNMYPADKPGERTTMMYEDLEFDIDIDESFFSLRNLQRRR
jgi:outer membrane lipoprotein-sorting protein